MMTHLPYRLGVGIMLLNAEGKVFVAKRIDTLAEAWQMPQGGIDDGEDAERAAYRELEEETGIARHLVQFLARTHAPLTYDLPEDLIPKLWHGAFRGQQQHWFAMRLLAGDEVINIATAHPEFSEYQWIDMHELPNVIVPFKRAMYKEIVAYFSQALGA